MTIPDSGYASWMLAILPQIDQSNLYNSWNSNHAHYDPSNVTTVRSIVAEYLCPDDLWSQEKYYSFAAPPGECQMAFSSYVGSLGSNFIVDYFDWGPGIVPDGVLYRQSRVRTADIADGTSHTLLVGERVHVSALLRPVWAYGFTGKVVADSSGGIHTGDYPHPHWSFSSFHPTGSQFALADGSVRLLTRDVDAGFLSKLATRAGQELDPDQSF